MALQRQLIDLPFVGGADTKTDPKQVLPTKLLSLKNATFETPKKLRKRNGFPRVRTGTGYEYWTGLGSVNGTPVGITNGMTSSGHVLDAGVHAFNSKYESTLLGGHTPSAVTYKRCVSTTSPIRRVDCIVGSSVTFVGWHDISTGITAQIIDNGTGTALGEFSTTHGNAGDAFLLCETDSFYHLIWVNRDSGVVLTDTPFSKTTYKAQSDVELAIGLYTKTGALGYTETFFDAASINNSVVCAYSTTSYGKQKVVSVDDALTVGYSYVLASDVYPDHGITLWADYASDDNGTSVAFAASDGTNIYYEVRSYDLTTSIANASVAAAGANRLTGASQLTRSVVFYGVDPTGDDGFKTMALPIHVRTPGAPTLVSQWVRPIGKATPDDLTTTFYIPVGFESVNLDQSYACIVRTDKEGALEDTVARLTPGTWWYANDTLYAVSALPTWNAQPGFTGSAGVYHLATLSITAGAKGLNAASVEFGVYTVNVRPFRSAHVESAGGMLMAGGVLGLVDGSNSRPYGHMFWPDRVTTDKDRTGQANTYSYVVCYEFTDAAGNVHRSAPSVPVQASVADPIGAAGGGAASQVTVTMSTLPLDVAGGVNLQIYRTEANQTLYYRLTGYQFGTDGTIPINDTTSQYVTFVDDIPDTRMTQAGNELLYTAGGILENIFPPACSIVTTHRNRVFLVDSCVPNTIWFSKLVTPGGPVEFNDAQVINVDPAGGSITALASMDDKLIVFKSNAIYYVLGQGPDSTGQQNDFTDAMPIAVDQGCTNSGSVVMIPSGLVFRSSKGVHVLTRGMSVEFIGYDIDAEVQDKIIYSAMLMPVYHQVRLLTSGPAKMLVYDYLVGQWSVFDLPCSPVSSVVHNSAQLCLDQTGLIHKESPGAYSDGDPDDPAWIPMSLKTPWIKLNGMQGYQRIRRFLVMGDWASAVRLSCFVAYDYGAAETPIVVSYDTAPTSDLVQLRVDLARQKCEAIQVSLSDAISTSVGATPGEGLSLNGLTLEVGIKQGTNKLSATKIAGTQGASNGQD